MVDNNNMNASFSMTEDGAGFVKQDSIRFSQSNFLYHHKTEEPIDVYYDMGELLGEGGFGVVYRGTHKQTGAQRAIKRMEKDPRDQDLNDEIIREFEFLKELDHPNLIKVYDMFEDKPHFHIVSDLYGGGDLIDYLEEAVYLQEEQVQVFMNKLLSCIEYLHDSRHMVHRDLKLENVLLDTDQNLADLKLIDFGLARHFARGENFYELCGSTAYVAPQVIEGQYTAKCDIWSCGVIAYCLLSGYTPFEGYDDGETLQTILVGSFDFDDEVWESVSKHAKDFICNLLAYEERDRPTAKQALDHPWLQNHRAAQFNESTGDMGESLKESLRGLRHFTSKGCKLKQAACAVMASQLLHKEEKENLTVDFRFLNRSLGGSITRQDLQEALAHVQMDDSDTAVDAIMEQVNFSGSGSISYSEFTIAMMFERDMVDDKKLRLVFNLMDKDGDGAISNADLQKALGLSEEKCAKMLAPLHCNPDTGMLSYEQFTQAIHSDEDMDGSNYLSSSFRMDDTSLRRRDNHNSTADFPETVEEGDENLPEESGHTATTKTTSEETPVPVEEPPTPDVVEEEEPPAAAAVEETPPEPEQEDEEAPKKPPPDQEVAAPPTPAGGKMTVERLRFVYMWYMRFGHPDRNTFLRRAAKMGDTTCNVTKEEIMSLPWICGGALIPVKEINKANASNVDSESGDITNKRASMREESDRAAAKAAAEAKKAEEEKKAAEEEAAAKKAKEEAEQKAKEEAERKAKEEAAKKAEAEKKAQEEAAKKAKEEAEKKAAEVKKNPASAFMTPSEIKKASKISSLAAKFGGAPAKPVRTSSNKNPLKPSSVLTGGATDTLTTELKIDSIHSESGKAETVVNTRQAAPRREVTIFGPTRKAPDFDWKTLENKTLKIASVEERKLLKPSFTWTCIARTCGDDSDESKKENVDIDNKDLDISEKDSSDKKDDSESAKEDELDISGDQMPDNSGNQMPDTSDKESSPRGSSMSASEPGQRTRRRSSNIFKPSEKSAGSQKMKFPKNNRRSSVAGGATTTKPRRGDGKRRVSTRD